MEVKFAAEAAGNVAGNRSSGTVPESRLEAFYEEPSIPDASVSHTKLVGVDASAFST